MNFIVQNFILNTSFFIAFWVRKVNVFLFAQQGLSEKVVIYSCLFSCLMELPRPLQTDCCGLHACNKSWWTDNTQQMPWPAACHRDHHKAFDSAALGKREVWKAFECVNVINQQNLCICYSLATWNHFPWCTLHHNFSCYKTIGLTWYS